MPIIGRNLWLVSRGKREDQNNSGGNLNGTLTRPINQNGFAARWFRKERGEKAFPLGASKKRGELSPRDAHSLKDRKNK